MIRPTFRTLLPALLVAALPLLASPPAAAQEIRPIPESLRGTWFSGACEEPDAMLAVFARSVARVPATGPGRLDRFTEAHEQGGWTLGISRGVEQPRLLLRGTAAGLDTAEPDNKTRDDRLPGDAPVSAWRRCDAPPAAWVLRHGEALAVLASLEVVEAACTGPVAPCAEALVAQADVSGDRLLSTAELARLVRGLAWITALGEGASAEEAGLVTGGGVIGGVVLARMAVQNLDYDDDGKLSARELTQDRAGFPAGGGAAAGRPLRLEGIGEAIAFLRGLVDGLLGGER
ncbi:hypothetical protein [Roseomonas sp. BN140053]|uniref:hypothetical protein n=1 Tax=Roseomonas sp. BN140053 TaxID=3391898 RepID=UPI0039ED2419